MGTPRSRTVADVLHLAAVKVRAGAAPGDAVSQAAAQIAGGGHQDRTRLGRCLPVNPHGEWAAVLGSALRAVSELYRPDVSSLHSDERAAALFDTAARRVAAGQRSSSTDDLATRSG